MIHNSSSATILIVLNILISCINLLMCYFKDGQYFMLRIGIQYFVIWCVILFTICCRPETFCGCWSIVCAWLLATATVICGYLEMYKDEPGCETYRKHSKLIRPTISVFSIIFSIILLCCIKGTYGFNRYEPGDISRRMGLLGPRKSRSALSGRSASRRSAIGLVDVPAPVDIPAAAAAGATLASAGSRKSTGSRRSALGGSGIGTGISRSSAGNVLTGGGPPSMGGGGAAASLKSGIGAPIGTGISKSLRSGLTTGSRRPSMGGAGAAVASGRKTAASAPMVPVGSGLKKSSLRPPVAASAPIGSGLKKSSLRPPIVPAATSALSRPSSSRSALSRGSRSRAATAPMMAAANVNDPTPMRLLTNKAASVPPIQLQKAAAATDAKILQTLSKQLEVQADKMDTAASRLSSKAATISRMPSMNEVNAQESVDRVQEAVDGLQDGTQSMKELVADVKTNPSSTVKPNDLVRTASSIKESMREVVAVAEQAPVAVKQEMGNPVQTQNAVNEAADAVIDLATTADKASQNVTVGQVADGKVKLQGVIDLTNDAADNVQQAAIDLTNASQNLAMKTSDPNVQAAAAQIKVNAEAIAELGQEANAQLNEAGENNKQPVTEDTGESIQVLSKVQNSLVKAENVTGLMNVNLDAVADANAEIQATGTTAGEEGLIKKEVNASVNKLARATEALSRQSTAGKKIGEILVGSMHKTSIKAEPLLTTTTTTGGRGDLRETKSLI